QNAGRNQPFPEVSHTTWLKRRASTAGFEPARAMPNRFQVYRLNHSAKLTGWILSRKEPIPLFGYNSRGYLPLLVSATHTILPWFVWHTH
ncbi:hypothetical protein MARPO_0077s0045, partial [Marchantia polymorpha]